ncbi:MAG TPA: carboxymuconolactone decarboxylase family protein [Candidatus Acidoferrales bacterium]|nr:carboxymuconolactone decarboxylase family protein [Candidatus Acidoferrales bacterium]
MPDLWSELAARPELARTLARHVAELERGTLPPRTRELCALMVSWLNACERCLEAHAEVAAGLGVDAATLEELADYARSDRFDDAERSALAAAVALTREPRGLPPAIAAQLRAHFDDVQVVEIVAAVGLYNYLTRANNALRSTGRARDDALDLDQPGFGPAVVQ